MLFSWQDEGTTGIKFIQKDFSLMKDAQALGKQLEPADLVVLTHGILAAGTRVATAEGIEQDMAVSTLSRLVILRELIPRLSTSRIVVYGMPGNGMKFDHFDDLNAEKSYAGGFGFVHANTVGGNEAIVLHHAASEELKRRGVSIFGANPGLLATNIRGVLYGDGIGSIVGGAVEKLMSWFTPSLEAYAERMVPLFFAPGLEEHSGAMFGQSATAIKCNPEFEPKGRATEWYQAMEALVKRCAGI